MKLLSSIKWYSKGLYPHPYTEGLLLLVILLQVSIFSNSLISQSSYYVVQFIAIPLIVLSNGLHFMRGQSITVFEVALLGSWSRVSLGKIAALFMSFIPFIAAESALLVYFGHTSLLLLVIASVFVYSSVVLFSSLLSSSSISLFLTVSVLFLVPFSITALLQDYAIIHLRAGLIMSGIVYFLSPVIALEGYKGHYLSMAPLLGAAIAMVASVILLVSYHWIFVRTQIKP